jgi:hypothetical protein
MRASCISAPQSGQIGKSIAVVAPADEDAAMLAIGFPVSVAFWSVLLWSLVAR